MIWLMVYNIPNLERDFIIFLRLQSIKNFRNICKNETFESRIYGMEFGRMIIQNTHKTSLWVPHKTRVLGTEN